jgi:mxaA protein
MRIVMLLLSLLLSCADARATTAEIHSERPFGYFVGDLIHAFIDIRADGDADLRAASLPSPGPLTISLDLHAIRLEPVADAAGRRWRLHLTYQIFYVSLDVRDIKIPGFTLIVARPGGDEPLSVPAWSVGVAPLRAVTPTKAEEAIDYLRPDGDPPRIGERERERWTFALAAAALLALLAVARDRAFPPFHLRRARRFARLARRLGVLERRPDAAAQVAEAAQSLHRAIDATAGRSILQRDLAAFLDAHPQFAPAQAPLRRFFDLSERFFFGGVAARDDDMAALAALARDLAQRERAR